MKCLSPSSVSSLTSPSRKIAVDLSDWSIYPVLGDEAIKVVGYSQQSQRKKCSGSISMRVNPRCVVSKSGTMYNLSGPIHDHSNLPLWLIKDFNHGFPSNWKKCVFKYLDWLQSVQSDADSETEGGKKDIKIKHSLFKWAIHTNHNHIFVEGFVLSDNGVPQLYRTSAIQKAITDRLLKTLTGSVYNLKGPLCLESTLQAKVPLHLAHKFDAGFPRNWKELIPMIEKFTETSNESFHSVTEDSDVVSLYSASQPRARVSLPQLQWPSLLSSGSDDQDTTLNVSDFSTDVQVPNTVRSTRTAKRNTIKEDIDEIHLNCDVLSTPTNTNMKKNSKVESPSLHQGFYRTRSGRHVLPPLQHWTGQRLVSEYDESGKQLVVLYPGNKSILHNDELSPAQDLLRSTSWLQRQHKMNQLLQSESKTATEPNCVKKLSSPINQSMEHDKRPKPCSVVITPLSIQLQNSESGSCLKSQSNKCETDRSATYFKSKTNENACVSTYNLRRSVDKKTEQNFGSITKTENKKSRVKRSKKNDQKSSPNAHPKKLPRGKGKAKDKPENNLEASGADVKITRDTKTTDNKKIKETKMKRKADFVVEEPRSKRPKPRPATIKRVTQNEAEDKPVTARKGTLKHRRQVKAVLGSTNTGNLMIDIFAGKPEIAANTAANSLAFNNANFDMFATAVTPISKLSHNFTTPSWFKTPAGCLSDGSVLQSETPAHLRSSANGESKSSAHETDKVIVGVQKMKQKSSKVKNGRGMTPGKRKTSQATVGVSKDLFNKTSDTVYSSDDEYFSDA